MHIYQIIRRRIPEERLRWPFRIAGAYDYKTVLALHREWTEHCRCFGYLLIISYLLNKKGKNYISFKYILRSQNTQLHSFHIT
jgi:hypothetical protein